jgi:hypothetical protein
MHPVSRRDEFSLAVTTALARRASYICSNPDCRALTLCPSDEDPLKSIYVGRAAHITAASPGGPRYDPSVTQNERGEISNAIFLCAVCADMIDKNNGLDFTADLLRQWKANHEVFVRTNLNKSVHSLLGARAPVVELAFDNGSQSVEILKHRAGKESKVIKSELSDRIVRIDLSLSNIGTGAATDLDCNLEFQGTFQIYKVRDLRNLWNMFPLSPLRTPKEYFERAFSSRSIPASQRVVEAFSDNLNFGLFESLIGGARVKLSNSVSRPVAASIEGTRVSFKVKKLKQNLAQPLESLFIMFPSWSSIKSFTVGYRINLEENSVDRVGQLSAIITKPASSTKRSKKRRL